MALDVRDFSMAGQFAKSAQTTIPAIPISGQAYRNPSTGKTQIELGQAYDQIGASAFWNQVMYLATGIARHSEQFAFVPWSAFTDYVGDASWCLGQDGTPYHAIADSGPGDATNPGVGAKPPPDADYWETLADYVSRMWNGGSGGGGGGGGAADTSGTGALVYPGAFADFFEQSPPTGWMVRNGGLINNASAVVPDLYAELQLAKNAFKLATEAEWQAMSAASPWTGIGGVPRFVLDTSANSIRLPDTRGMYKEDIGFDGLAVGGAHGDATRPVSGSFPGDDSSVISQSAFTGPFTFGGDLPGTSYANGVGVGARYLFKTANVVPTASVNRPKAFGVLGCVYVGKIGS